MAVTMAARERTFIMIKPDAVQRGLVGDIIKRFEQKGFKLVGLKFKQAGGCRSIPAYSPLSHIPTNL
jgi:nucleoside diphosphate kinase